MNRNLTPAPVRACCEILWSAGFQAYPVGGCVRDLLLGIPPEDWDVASSAPPSRTAELFQRTIPTGIRHGTVTVLLGGMSIEVTSFRGEGDYTDGRHPDTVTFGVSLQEDLARRDFTVNAMALRHDGRIIDPFGGQNDLAGKCIRCVGDPDRRFQEDGLRMLRALRFAACLGFSLEENTAAALARNAAGLERVSGERVKAELEKILLSPRPELSALPVKLGMLERFGAAARSLDLSALCAVTPISEERWRTFCQVTGLDITLLPVERHIRRAVLREDAPEPALSGRDLYDLGLRKGEIGQARRRLSAHIAAHPEDNTTQRLLELIHSGGPHTPHDTNKAAKNS